MANTQAQFGFKHIGYLSGYAPDYQETPVLIQSTYSTAIGFGDPVAKSGAYIVRADPANNTTQIRGIFQGCRPTYAAVGYPTPSPGWSGSAAAADTVGYVVDAPGALFLVATLLTAVTTTNIGNAVGFTTSTPSTVGGMYSVATIDQSTATSTGTTASLLPFKIVSLYQGIGNGSDASSNYNWAIVTFNDQAWKVPQGA